MKTVTFIKVSLHLCLFALLMILSSCKSSNKTTNNNQLNTNNSKAKFYVEIEDLIAISKLQKIKSDLEMIKMDVEKLTKNKKKLTSSKGSLFSLSLPIRINSAINDSNNEDCQKKKWCIDNDADGLGDPNKTVEACEQPDNYVSLCIDTNDNQNLRDKVETINVDINSLLAGFDEPPLPCFPCDLRFLSDVVVILPVINPYMLKLKDPASNKIVGKASSLKNLLPEFGGRKVVNFKSNNFSKPLQLEIFNKLTKEAHILN